jgi:hypothetical protein
MKIEKIILALAVVIAGFFWWKALNPDKAPVTTFQGVKSNLPKPD